MRLRLCGLPVVLLGLTLVACGETSRRVVVVEKPDDQEEEKKVTAKPDEKKDDKDGDKKQDRDKDKDKKEQPKNADLGDVHAEITVLQVLHSLDLSAAQLKAMAELAEKTSQKEPPRKDMKVSDRYRKALLELRAALRAADDEKIEAAHGHLDAAREKDGEPEFDEVEITDGARKAAPLLFEKLNARQVAFYLSGLGNSFPDPTERMLESLAESRSLENKAWRALRDDVSYQAAWLIAGLDAEKDGKMRERIANLLDEARELKEKEFAEKKPRIEQTIRELAGKLTATDVIRHYVERVLAETLSNHRLAAAVEGRQKK